MTNKNMPTRRELITTAAIGGAGLVLPSPSLLAAVVPTPRQTLGPFYPDKLPLEYDNDLTTVAGQAQMALGEIAEVTGRVLDESGQGLAGINVEIWQCDFHGRYHHPRDRNDTPIDLGFQGYGRTISNDEGAYRFRTIKPVSYPGRTPHIHFRLSGQGVRELITQMYIAGERGNARDGVLNGIANETLKQSLIVDFQQKSMDGIVILMGKFDIVLQRV